MEVKMKTYKVNCYSNEGRLVATYECNTVEQAIEIRNIWITANGIQNDLFKPQIFKHVWEAVNPETGFVYLRG